MFLFDSYHVSRDYCNFAYSVLASFRIGMSGSASFQRLKKDEAYRKAGRPDRKNPTADTPGVLGVRYRYHPSSTENAPCAPGVHAKEVPAMPVTKEFIVLMEDRPSTLGKLCQALADRGVNILALQSFPIGGKSVTRFIVDNPTTAKTVLDTERLTYVEAEIVQAKLPHRPGEIARVASRLGEANININYAYCGLEPGTNTPLVFFGVAEVSKAAPILEQAAAATAKP
jgi:hypothetical protein